MVQHDIPMESEVDPASYEHFIETLRQGSAGALRGAASARVLQREAHKTSTFAKVAVGHGEFSSKMMGK